MKDYAICFRTIFSPDTCRVSIPGTFGIERLNIIIFGLKTSTLIPYTLYIAKNVYSEDERNAMYGILESYIMRRMVVHSLESVLKPSHCVKNDDVIEWEHEET